MRLGKTIRTWWGVLRDPKEAFASIERKRFETLLEEYLLLLAALALATAACTILLSAARTAFYALFLHVDVGYGALASYTIAGATGTAFFVAFAGTFLLFFLSIILRAIYYDVPYVVLLRALILAATPLLLFGWIVPAALGLAVWGAALFVSGMPLVRAARGKRKGTIGERE